MPRLLAFFSLIVLIGLAVWLVFSPPQSGEIENDTDPVEIQQPELEEVSGLAEEQLPEPEDVGALQRTDIEPIRLGGNDPNVEYGEPVSEGILVTVVDADGGELLPFAEVIVLDMGVLDESTFQMQMMQQPDFETVFAHLGVVYSTDKSAKVMIPFPEGELILAGRTDTHFDFSMSTETADDEVELAIKHVALLRVHVIDENGADVEGAPVGLRIKQDIFKQDMMRNFTAEDGWTNLRLFQLLLDRLPADGTFVAIMGLFQEPIEKLVDLQELPEDGVELVMPESGSMTVTVVDEEGNPVEDYLGIMLNIVDPDPGPRMDEEIDQADFVDTTQTGTLTIPRIGFGLDITVKATSINEILTGTVVVEGPTRSHPHVDVQVTISMEASVIKGRLVNAEGKPGPNITLRSRLVEEHEHGSSSTGRSVRTDEEGYFRVKLDDPDLGPNATRKLTLTMKATRKKPERDAEIDLSRSFPPGETDFGDIMVTAPPLAASGRVLKPDSTPLRDAEIVLERKEASGDGPDDFYWDSMLHKRARTDKDGSFTVVGRFEPGTYRVRVSSPQYPSVHQPTRIGEEGMEITMAAGGGLTGTLLLDKDIPRDQLDLRLERHQDSLSDPDVNSGFGINVETSGKFQHLGLTPGTFNIVLNCSDTDEELFRKDGVIVNLSDDGIATDVGTLDLRGQLRAFEVNFRNKEDKVVRDARVTIGDSDNWHYVWKGRISVVTAKPGLDITIVSDGYRKLELKNVSGDETATLLQGIKVRLQVSNPQAIPPGYAVRLTLRSAEPNSRSAYMYGIGDGLNSSYEQVVNAMEPGEFFVECQLSSDEGDQANTWWGISQPEGASPIQVVDVGGEQFFSIEINAERIASIVKRTEDSE